MKKFYTIALAASLAASVSARELQLIDLQDARTPAQKITNIEKTRTGRVTMRKVADSTKSLNTLSTPRQNATSSPASIEGIWAFVVGDYYYESSINGETTVLYSAEYDAEDKFVWFESLTDEAPFIADIDEKGTLTFGAEVLAYANQAQTEVVAQMPYIYNWTTQDLDYGTYTAQYDEAAGTITFLEDFGIDWPILEYSKFTGKVGNLLGYYWTYDFLSGAKFESDIDEVQDGQWRTVGTATLRDGWIIPGYVDQNENPLDNSKYTYSVELQQKVGDHGVLRLWRPYQTSSHVVTGSGLNQSLYNGQIVFDITDADHVMVCAGQPAGFKNNNGEFYVTNLLGYFAYTAFGNSYNRDSHLPTLISLLSDNGLGFDTYKNNVVTINTPIFDYDVPCAAGYSWKTPQISTITLPDGIDTGVADIMTDTDNNAPVEYFNLQGVRVANPTPGQLIIRRQGNTSTKVIVK